MSLPVPRKLLEPMILRALEEDLAQGGDITTLATVPPEAEAIATLNTREDATLCGVTVAALVFEMVSDKVTFPSQAVDGQSAPAGSAILTVQGPAQALLTAERTALNIISHMTGIATATAHFVKLIEGTDAHIAATRKTLPGLRLLQKHAVRSGGGMTHRISLSDAVMIKDNHIVAAGGLTAAIARARRFAGHTVKIEVEVDTLEQLREVLPHKPDIILLDNMTTDDLRQAVALTQGQSVLEASGGVSEATVRAIAETGVDVVSVGALTHSVRATDIGMELSL
ncbi:MAG: carboxylating nicotinate-nucleotide diphosphorylase [Pseudomonadota bacterium]